MSTATRKISASKKGNPRTQLENELATLDQELWTDVKKQLLHLIAYRASQFMELIDNHQKQQAAEGYGPQSATALDKNRPITTPRTGLHHKTTMQGHALHGKEEENMARTMRLPKR